MTDSSSRRREGVAHLVHVDVARSAEMPVVSQLYLALRQAIVAGQMPAGERLPSTRAASALWKVSRGSVVQAYEILVSEGYATGHPGSGTYVADDVPQRLNVGKNRKSQMAAAEPNISTAAKLTLAAPCLDPPPQVAFVTGRSAPDEKSRAVLKRLGHRHVECASTTYEDPQGQLSLREAVAAYLTAARGLRCTAKRIIITSGAQQAIDLAVRTLIDPGDQVAIEDPAYPAARLALAAHGAKLVPVAVDENGVDPDLLAKAGKEIRAVYVTPSHQYPTGSTLSMARRFALIDWASSHDAWIFEDDYDSEFRYDERPLAALQGIDDHERVIYIGTFSKALLPGLRIGHLVVPDDLVAAFRSVRVLMDRFPAPFQQLVVADFLAEGHFSTHLRRLREGYRTSRDCLFHLLNDRLSDYLVPDLPSQGIHLLARLRGTMSDVTIADLAARAGVTVLPVSPMSFTALPRQGLVLGFAGLSEKEADLGTRRLANALQSVGQPSPGQDNSR